MKLFVRLLLMVLVGCIPRIDQELEPFVDSYVQDAKEHGWLVQGHVDQMYSVRVTKNLPENILGRSFDDKRILISEDILCDFNLLRAVMYHEMSHNVFGLKHCVCSNNSIMNAIVTNTPDIYSIDIVWDWYVDEMFKQIKKEYKK